MAQREVPFAKRTIDANTVLDLFCVLYTQVKAAVDMSEALSCDIVMPYSQELFDIILDGLGAPDGDDFREPFYDMFYSRWVLDNEFADVHAFMKEFKFHFEDHLHMHSLT